MSEEQQEQQQETQEQETQEQAGQGEQVGDGAEQSLDSRMREQQEQIEALRGELARMRALPHLVGTTPGGEAATDRRQFAAMGYSERVKLRRENPALYTALTD